MDHSPWTTHASSQYALPRIEADIACAVRSMVDIEQNFDGQYLENFLRPAKLSRVKQLVLIHSARAEHPLLSCRFREKSGAFPYHLASLAFLQIKLVKTYKLKQKN